MILPNLLGGGTKKSAVFSKFFPNHHFVIFFSVKVFDIEIFGPPIREFFTSRLRRGKYPQMLRKKAPFYWQIDPINI